MNKYKRKQKKKKKTTENEINKKKTGETKTHHTKEIKKKTTLITILQCFVPTAAAVRRIRDREEFDGVLCRYIII